MAQRGIVKLSRRVVIKAGTSILTSEKGLVSREHLEKLGKSLLDLIRKKKEVALVSSGAIAFGMDACGFKKRPKTMSQLQACAAIGQGRMMHAYEQFFSRNQMKTAQILLTRDGLESRARFLAARHTFEELFKMKVLPIVNENDTVATDEIKFGDNDILSVHVAHLIHADLLVILSDVNGFYLKDGTRVSDVPSSAHIDHTLVKHLRDSKKEKTVGGMRAKLEAARTAMRLGVSLMIVSGHEPDILNKVFSGEDVGTLFHAEKSDPDARRKWIAFSAPCHGSVTVDQGAFNALKEGKKSLLPGGVLKIQGDFQRGQMLELKSPEGCVFGRGLSRYSSKEFSRIVGKKTSEIEKILGYKLGDEVIHRNDLFIWSDGEGVPAEE